MFYLDILKFYIMIISNIFKCRYYLVIDACTCMLLKFICMFVTKIYLHNMLFEYIRMYVSEIYVHICYLTFEYMVFKYIWIIYLYIIILINLLILLIYLLKYLNIFSSNDFVYMLKLIYFSLHCSNRLPQLRWRSS